MNVKVWLSNNKRPTENLGYFLLAMSWNIPPFILLRRLPVDCTLVRTSSSTSWFSLSTLVTSASSFSLQSNSCIAVSFEATNLASFDRDLFAFVTCFSHLSLSVVAFLLFVSFGFAFSVSLLSMGTAFSVSLTFSFPFSAHFLFSLVLVLPSAPAVLWFLLPLSPLSFDVAKPSLWAFSVLAGQGESSLLPASVVQQIQLLSSSFLFLSLCMD